MRQTLFKSNIHVLKAWGGDDFEVKHTEGEQLQKRGESVRAVEIDRDSCEAALA